MTGCVPAVIVSSSAQATSSDCRIPLYKMMFLSALYNLRQRMHVMPGSLRIRDKCSQHIQAGAVCWQLHTLDNAAGKLAYSKGGKARICGQDRAALLTLAARGSKLPDRHT